MSQDEGLMPIEDFEAFLSNNFDELSFENEAENEIDNSALENLIFARTNHNYAQLDEETAITILNEFDKKEDKGKF
jgi:hypothetical protein